MKLVACFLLLLAVPSFAATPEIVMDPNPPTLKDKVFDRIFEVKDSKKSTKGGTGFSVVAPSGKSYVVTNAHVCEVVTKVTDGEHVVLVQGDKQWKRKVLKISEKSDLCLIEGVKRVPGLSIANSITVGQPIYAVGHPNMGPIKMTNGNVTDFKDSGAIRHIMKSGDRELDFILDAVSAPCTAMKYKVSSVLVTLPNGITKKVKTCVVTEKKAMITTVSIKPGSSGSPVVNGRGKVVGVMFAVDITNGFGMAVNIVKLHEFLSDF